MIVGHGARPGRTNPPASSSVSSPASTVSTHATPPVAG